MGIPTLQQALDYSTHQLSPRLRQFGNIEWGCAQGVYDGIYTRPHPKETAIRIAQQTNALLRQADQVPNGRFIRMIKATVRGHHYPCYYVMINKESNPQGASEISPSQTFGELTANPIHLLNMRHDDEVSTVINRLKKHFILAVEQHRTTPQPTPTWIRLKAAPLDPQAIKASPTQYETGCWSSIGLDQKNKANWINEDIVLATTVTIQQQGYGEFTIPFYAVIDGHSPLAEDAGKPVDSLQESGGKQIAVYIADRLADRFTEKLNREFAGNSNTLESICLHFQNAFKLSFAELSSEAARQFHTYGAGASVTAACIINDALFVACAGDTKAIIAAPSSIMQVVLLPLLTALNSKAALSIGNRGEVLNLNDDGSLRTTCGLSVASALGHDHKCGVKPRPTVSIIPLKPILTADKYLLIGSGGLWKGLNDDLVRRVLSSEITPPTSQQIAQRLVTTASDHGSTKNLTALVVKLPSIKSFGQAPDSP